MTKPSEELVFERLCAAEDFQVTLADALDQKASGLLTVLVFLAGEVSVVAAAIKPEGWMTWVLALSGFLVAAGTSCVFKMLWIESIDSETAEGFPAWRAKVVQYYGEDTDGADEWLQDSVEADMVKRIGAWRARNDRCADWIKAAQVLTALSFLFGSIPAAAKYLF